MLEKGAVTTSRVVFSVILDLAGIGVGDEGLLLGERDGSE